MQEEDQAAELAREWRASVRQSLKENCDKLDKLIGDIAKFRGECANANDHHELADRVSSLEQNQSRFMGGIVVLNIIGSIVLSLILKFWR